VYPNWTEERADAGRIGVLANPSTLRSVASPCLSYASNEPRQGAERIESTRRLRGSFLVRCGTRQVLLDCRTLTLAECLP
jgi:hypothetical protein